MAIMKRFRDGDAEDSVACTLMLLSSGTIASPGYTNSTHHTNHNSSSSTTTTTTTSSGGGGGGGRVFECKTCNRQFSSFQALGGHRASHKRAKLAGDQDGCSVDGAAAVSSNPGPKVHECSICGTEFAMGQALGGHMRRHRAQLMGAAAADHHHPNLIVAAANKASAAASASATTKRLYLDLNYPPVDIDGDFLGMGLVGKVPMVHC